VARQDSRRGIQRLDFSKEKAEAASTWRTQPIYRRRKRSQTVSNSNSRSTKNRITSRRFRSTKETRYQWMLPHVLCHHGTRIWRDATYRFQEVRSIVMPVVSQ